MITPQSGAGTCVWQECRVKAHCTYVMVNTHLLHRLVERVQLDQTLLHQLELLPQLCVCHGLRGGRGSSWGGLAALGPPFGRCEALARGRTYLIIHFFWGAGTSCVFQEHPFSTVTDCVTQRYSAFK